MALTVVEFLRAVVPNIGLVQNADGSYRIGVEDINSDEILTAVEAINTALQVTGITQLQLAAMVTALQAILAGAGGATVETPFTGAGNVVVGTERIAPAAAFRLTEIELHLSAAPTTGAQNLVITLDDGVAPAYDLAILTLDLVANAVVDLVITPNKACKATDVITAAWTNTDGRTFGLKFKHQLL